MQKIAPAFWAASFLAASSAGNPAAAQTFTRTQDLSFGAFAAGMGGTVTISPQSARTASGDVILIGRSAGSPASFDVSGSANATYQIALPADGTAILTGSNGGSMSLSSFASSPSGQGQLNMAGTQTLHIGATLAIGSNQAPGPYSGSFSVTVVFE